MDSRYIIKIAFLQPKTLTGQMAQMPLYFTPGVGGALSARDAVNSALNVGRHLGEGRLGRAGMSALGVAGNSMLALADFVPVLGSVARGKIKALQLAGKGTKTFHVARGAARLAAAGGAGGARAGMMGHRLSRAMKMLKGVDNTTDAAKLVQRLSQGGDMNRMSTIARQAAEQMRAMKANQVLRGGRMPADIRRQYALLKQTQRAAQSGANFTRGYMNPALGGSIRHMSPGAVHGSMVRGLEKVLPHKTMLGLAESTKTGPMTSWMSGQIAGGRRLLGPLAGSQALDYVDRRRGRQWGWLADPRYHSQHYGQHGY